MLSLLGRSPPPITPKMSQRIDWRNKFHLCYTRKFSGNQLCNPNGPRASACAPLCCKNMCCASRLCMGGSGAAGSKSKQMSKGPYSKMLAQERNLRLRDEGGSRGRSSTQDEKTRTVSTCWINPGGLSLRAWIIQVKCSRDLLEDDKETKTPFSGSSWTRLRPNKAGLKWLTVA